MPHVLLKRKHFSLTDSSVFLATKIIALVAIYLSISMTYFDTGKSPVLTYHFAERHHFGEWMVGGRLGRLIGMKTCFSSSILFFAHMNAVYNS